MKWYAWITLIIYYKKLEPTTPIPFEPPNWVFNTCGVTTPEDPYADCPCSYTGSDLPVEDPNRCVYNTYNQGDDAPTQMSFFVTLKKGHHLYWFSWESDVKLCMKRDEDIQRVEVIKFAEELMKSLYPEPLPPYAVKSIENFVDATAIVGNELVGQDHYLNGISSGFVMMDFCVVQV